VGEQRAAVVSPLARHAIAIAFLLWRGFASTICCCCCHPVTCEARHGAFETGHAELAKALREALTSPGRACVSRSKMPPSPPPTMPLPPVLDRFLQAQEPVWPRVLAELRAGRKRTHWMWFVFPQFQGLGHSDMAQRYAIRSLAEARAYLAHPLLAGRLQECCQILLGLESASALDVMGTPDDLKLRSCMTLFAEASGPGSVFHAVLQKYFGGEMDARTVELLG
jgi:uncharacterized protein (DUF1810 family)